MPDVVVEEIEITYAEQKYYVENGEDVIISTTNKNYLADFTTWSTNAPGLAIISAIELDLAEDTPGE